LRIWPFVEASWGTDLSCSCPQQRSGPLVGFDLGLHVGQTGGHAFVGVEVEQIEKAEAAGTR
jgi:hypothetical protein